jgi:carbon storage regulator
MLILSRKEAEKVYLGNDIVLTIIRVAGDKVRIGIEAPSNVRVLRNELQKHDEQSELPVTLQVTRRAA